MNDSFFEILKNSNIFGVFIYQEEGKIVYANRRFCEILGYSENEILHKSFLELLLDDKDAVKSIIERRIRGERFANEHISNHFKSKSGAAVPITAFTYTIEYKGRNSGIVIVIDKTKEKTYEKLFHTLYNIEKIALNAESKDEIFKKVCISLVDNAGYSLAAIGSIDKKSKLFLPQYIKSKDEELGKNLLLTKIGVDTNTPYGMGVVSKAYNSRKIHFVNDVLDNQDMSHWHEIQRETGINSACAVPILNNNQIEYILLIIDKLKNSFNEDNIKLLEEIQLDLSNSLEKLESKQNMLLFSKALETSHEWAIITDKDANIIYANNAVGEISKYNLSELMGKNPNIFKSGIHLDEFYKELWDTITNGKVFSCRFTNKDKNGNLFYLETTITPIRNGEELYFIDLSKDITKLVEKEQALKLSSDTYNLLYHFTQLTATSKDRKTFFDKAIDIFTQISDFEAAFILKYDNNLFRIVNKSVKNEKNNKFFEIFQNYLKNNSDELYTFKKSFEKGYIYIENDISKKSNGYCQEYTNFGFASCCAIPIKQNLKTIAILILISNKTNFFNAKIYNLLKILSAELESVLSKLEKHLFSEMLLKSIDRSFDFAAITDKNFNITYISEKLESPLGQHILGKNFLDILKETNENKEIDNFLNILKQSDSISGIFKFKEKEGKIISVKIRITSSQNDDEINSHIIMGNKFKLEKNDFFANQMEKTLKFDALTNLYNLMSFKEKIELFIERAKHTKKIGAVIIINIISFKTVNMAFDFNVGNEILKEIATRITTNIRPYDIAAKLESDRFGILLKELEKDEDILVVSMRFLNAIKRPYEIEGKKINISFNIGLSIFPKDGEDSKTLIRKARLALVDSRQKGENEIGFFRSDLEEKLTKNLSLRMDLEEAVQKKEFVTYYQPYVDKDLNIAGAESLVRWKKDGKLIPPNDFIGLLETTPLIVDAENFVFDNALDTLKKFELIKIKPIPISINLSEKSLTQRRLSDNILSKINYYNIKKNLIKIEIIERSFIKNFTDIKTLMEELETEGIYFAVDDFGTGYSSLSYLSKLPFKIVKIDISFVREILNNKNTQSIVRSTIFLAKELNMKVTAEGVETKEQFEILKSYGCDYFQGYLFYKPMPEDKFIETLQKQQLKSKNITESQAKDLQKSAKKAINTFNEKSKAIFSIKRQAVVDINQKIFAYEILFQNSQGAYIKSSTDMTNYIKSIINLFQKMDIENLLNKHMGFINMNDKLILSDIIKLINKDKFIIEIDEDSTVSEEFIKRISALQRQGYRFALDNLTQSGSYSKFATVAERISFLKFDASTLNRGTIKNQVKNLKKIFKHLIAINIHSEEDFTFFKQIGFRYFMGSYFEAPISFKAKENQTKKIDTDKILINKIFELLNLVNSDKDVDDIEKVFDSLDDIALQFFDFVNSVHFSSSVVVSSIKQAIIVTGYKRFKAWLIYYFVNKTSKDSAKILKKAFIRGEILRSAAENLLGYKKSDEIFFIGVMSLSDVIFKKPKNEVLLRTNASQLAQDTILHNKGKLANVLTAIIADENRDFITLRANLNVIGIVEEQYLRIKEKTYNKFRTADSIREFIKDI